MTHDRLLTSQRTKVVRRESIHPSHAVLRVRPPGGPPCLPGHFAMLRLPGDVGRGFVLSRPFSILDAGETVDFLIRIVGKGSRLLASLEPGDDIEMLLPLGTPFPEPGGFSRPLAVAGGCGVAPLAFLARRACRSGGSLELLYGTGTASDQVLAQELSKICSLSVSTEDGTSGFRGTVAALLEETLRRRPADFIAACGPTGLLREVARIGRQKGAACFVSIETVMGCGFGACLGCAVPMSGGGYLYACKDGPVVDASRIDWSRWERPAPTPPRCTP
jgi:dihydroorotate dehydrogenase electron transfer subunit